MAGGGSIYETKASRCRGNSTSGQMQGQRQKKSGSRHVLSYVGTSRPWQ